jgi:xanthine dehydrogenase accessory factor
VAYTRNFRPPERLILLGCGHIGQALARFATELGFAVTAVDDRPDFASPLRFPEGATVLCRDFPSAIAEIVVTDRDYVAVLTRGHRFDDACMRALLAGTFPRYLGMVGSRRRVAALWKALEEDGFDPKMIEKVHAPIGLDIGALTVQEIAISILAQLIACRREGIDRRSKSAILTDEDVDLSLLRFLAEDREPKALLTVYDSTGSTPVKTGAMMAVDRNLRTVGTIGGGCGEGALLRQAHSLIGTGEKRTATVELNADIAEEEGLVCGGTMKVLMEDVTE